jgi:signal transduction histidine kinase
MANVNVRMLLFLSILVTATVPLLASLYLLDRAVQTSLNLGFSPHVSQALANASDNLRTLGRLDSEQRDEYRQRFEEVERLKHVYANPALVKSSIQDSLRTFFAAGVIATVLAAVLVAAALGQRIARSYSLAFEELSREREKVRYLQEMSSWQELARMLAHEIKNPLTPIEVLISSLSRAYLQKGEQEFQEQLAQTESMINDELSHLKNTVNRFGEFARLPQVQLVECDLGEIVAQHVKALSGSFEPAELRLSKTPAALPAKVDATLLRQVLANILRNGVEANPGRRVVFDIALDTSPGQVTMTIANDGAPVAADIADRIFDPYVSTRADKHNMGLGLAIVKKIVIEHGGDVAYAEQAGRPAFVISLPRLA